jgi:hypothetical protein
MLVTTNPLVAAGKGRSCHVAACYLLHSGQVEHAQQALDIISNKRGPGCVTIPSQIRYVYYYEKLLRTDRTLMSTFRLSSLRMAAVPAFNASLVNSGCTPNAVIYAMAVTKPSIEGVDGNSPRWSCRTIYHGNEDKTYLSRQCTPVDFHFAPQDIHVRGDFCLALYSEGEKMCQLWLHTAFVDSESLHFDSVAVDLAHADVRHRTFPANFALELRLERVSDIPEINIVDTGHTRLENEDCAVNDMQE